MPSGTRYQTHSEALKGIFKKVAAWWLETPRYAVGIISVSVLFFLLGQQTYPLYTVALFAALSLAVLSLGTSFICLYTALAGGTMSREERERRSEGSPPN